jgi:hypothetical protein
MGAQSARVAGPRLVRRFANIEAADIFARAVAHTT